MGFNQGDLVIATSINGEANSFVNGDIVQIIKKISNNRYNVKVIHKSDEKTYDGEYDWVLCEEYKYFELY